MLVSHPENEDTQEHAGTRSHKSFAPAKCVAEVGSEKVADEGTDEFQKIGSGVWGAVEQEMHLRKLVDTSNVIANTM